MKHLEYLRYVIIHKWFVFLAGRKLGVSRLQLLVHDFQKLSPSEWRPYVEKFYGDSPDDWDQQFDLAWLHHQKLGGKHHWQYWLLQEDDGALKPLEMPEKYVREMVADWIGAGRAITGSTSCMSWYVKNYDKIKLHGNTRRLVDQLVLGG